MSVAAERAWGEPPTRVELKVPHHCQLSEHWGLGPEEIRRICAPVCLKTVLDYKIPETGEAGLPLADIIGRILSNGGRSENGWHHAAEVAALRSYGLNAWRRDWAVTDLQAELSRRRERYAPAQRSAVEDQRQTELFFPTPLEKARASFVASLLEGNPVIASVAPGFSENRGPHQVVIHGYEENSGSLHLLLTDPVIEDRAHQEALVSWEYFAAFFNQRAIFVDDRQREEL